MRHRVAGKKLGRPSDQRVALLRSLARELIRREKIVTTLAKATEARRVVEKLISHGKRGTIHHRRLTESELPHKEAVKKIFEELAPRYADRPGGYTRMIKLGPRKGDAAPMALVEFV